MVNKFKKRVMCAFLVIAVTMPLMSGLENVNANKLDMQNQKIKAQYEDMAVIKNDGSLWAWGNDSYVKLGDGTNKDKSTPIKIMNNVVAVSGGSHMAVIKTDGSLWTWGYNGEGQLGDGTNKSRYTPKKVMDKIKKVSCGDSYTAVIKTDGSLWTWGANNYGQLGNGKINSSPTAGIKPTKVMNNVAEVCAGTNHTVAIKTDGSLWTWGQNWGGQLGDNIAGYRYTPKKVMDNVAAVSTAFGYTAAIKTDGSLWTFGSNRSGQLGDGTETNSYKPKKVLDNVIAVSTSVNSAAAIKADGSLWTWGSNRNGQVGDGTTIDRLTPVKVMEEVVAVSVGLDYFAAQKTDGSLWICGYNGINPWSKVPIRALENVAFGASAVQKTIPYQVKDNIKVLFNNKQIIFEQPPIVKGGEILVSANEFFKSIGSTFKWKATSQSITASKGDINLSMQIDFNFLTRNGIQNVLNYPPQIIKGKVYIPVKSVAEAYSASYDFDENIQVVSINTLDTKLAQNYVKYEEKMKTYGFDKLYNNKRANTNEPVTKAEALKLALGAVFNTYDISDFAAEHNEYENAIWVEYAKNSEITTEDISGNNIEEKAKYIDVITYLENCKIKFLKDQPIKAMEVKLKDISEYNTEQQAAIQDMVANQIIGSIAESLNGNQNVFKGQLNELVVNFVEKYNTIAPFGDKLVLDPKKLPSNANQYPYILASVDKSIYEKPFMNGFSSRKISPKEFYTMKKDSYSQFQMRSEDFLNNILNIDYRTITEEGFKDKISQYLVYKPNDANIRYYIKHVKDNEIIIEGNSKLQLPIIYYDGYDYRFRLRLNFEVKHSKTKDLLLYLDIFNDEVVTYKNKKYDILVDYFAPITKGDNNIYLDEIGLYKGIIDKDKCGITQKK